MYRQHPHATVSCPLNRTLPPHRIGCYWSMYKDVYPVLASPLQPTASQTPSTSQLTTKSVGPLPTSHGHITGYSPNAILAGSRSCTDTCKVRLSSTLIHKSMFSQRSTSRYLSQVVKLCETRNVGVGMLCTRGCRFTLYIII